MFLKNKTARFSIKLLDQNRRSAVRVNPATEEICLRVYGQTAQIHNLSSSGVAFSFINGQYALPTNKIEFDATLSVSDSEANPINATLKLISSKDGLYRCQMVLQQRGFNSLCQYLVRHQIASIRKLQKNKTESPRQDPNTSIIYAPR